MRGAHGGSSSIRGCSLIRVETRLAASPGAATSSKQRGKKSAESFEEAARRRVIRRCSFSASGLLIFAPRWRKRSGQWRCCSWTRIQRQRTHVLNRSRRRAGRMEHERRLYLHVKFIRRDGGVKRSGRGRYSSSRQTSC